MQQSPQPKFKNKYRIGSHRLQNWDYSNDGFYFVTICTKNKQHFFGEIKNQEMILNQFGKIAQKFWQEIPQHFNNTELDEFIIMPNHIHGIIGIKNENCRNADLSRFKTTNDLPHFKNENNAIGFINAMNHIDIANTGNAMNRVSTKTGGVTKQHNPMLHKNLATMMRWFKGRCSFEINKSQNQINFQWQPRYYDHIIRNEESLTKIQQYIFENPIKWEFDEENVEFKNKI